MSVAMQMTGTDMKGAAGRPSARERAGRATVCPKFDDERLTPSEQKALDHDLRILAWWGFIDAKPRRREPASSARAQPARSKSRR